MGVPGRTARGGGGWRPRAARAATVALVLVAFAGGFAQPASADDPLTEALKRKQDLERAVAVSRANTERYRSAASQFQAVVNQTNAQIATLAERQAAADSEAEALGYEIEIAEEQLALVSFQLEETRAFAESLRSQAVAQAKQLDRREELYALHLRTTYRQALISPLEMLLGSSSLTEFASRLAAMIRINRQDVQLASEIRALRADTARKQDEASAKEKEILGLQDQIAVTRGRLALEKARYDAMVDEAQSAIDQQAQRRAGAAANRNSAQGAANQANRQTADLQRQLEDAEARYTLLAAQAAGKSGLGAFTGAKVASWPLTGPITSPYGPRWGGFHNGVDIAAPMYTPIVAAAFGKVVTVGRPYLAYGNNFSTLYGHLDDRFKPPPVRVGQTVTAGETIGFVGMTGFTTGPHLHFMTILDGRAVNPVPYLP